MSACLRFMLLLGCACKPVQPFVLLTIEDPSGAAEPCDTFAAGSDPAKLESFSRKSKDFPLTVTLLAASEGEQSLIVEARSGNVAIGRGHVNATFARNGTPTATVVLAKACGGDSECGDGLFCTGSEACFEGMCRPGSPPCTSSFECVVSTCAELLDGDGVCNVQVEHSLCGDATLYCSPIAGCVPGQSCAISDDCQDTFVCNGVEQCVDFHCQGGSPPNPNDDNICTLDGCNDALGVDAIFHFPDPSKNGNSCDIDASVQGICIAASGGCVESICGDDFLDVFLEECDDGNTDNTDDCVAGCQDAGCGDGFVHAGAEVCDDTNNASGDGCRGDCGKAEVCGDGIVDEGEACDDGNVNPNDGCDADAGVCRQTTWDSSLVLGLGASGGSATSLALYLPMGVALDVDRNVYVADTNQHRVVRIEHGSGIPTVIAGTGSYGLSGDGGPATAARLSFPAAVAVDGAGNVYIADSSNHRIRRICADGVGCTPGSIATFAGSSGGLSGDGGPAPSAKLAYPRGVAVDGAGNVYIADSSNSRVRKVCSDGVGCVPGTISTVAGTSLGFSGDGGLATSAQLHAPQGIAVDAAGDILVTDTENHRVRKICKSGVGCANGTIETIAGTTWGSSGDGGPAASAQLKYPGGIAIDGGGNLLIADAGNHAIRKVCADGVGCTVGTILTVVGTLDTNGFSGDASSALSALLDFPNGIAVDQGGNLFVADTGNARVRRVCSDGIGCVAGVIGTIGGAPLAGFGDGGPATCAELNYPGRLATDSAGNVYMVDTNHHRVRKLCVSGIGCNAGFIQTVAGTTQGFSGNGGPATLARLDRPSGVAIDAGGNIYIGDYGNHQVRRVCIDGVGCTPGMISTIAGTTQGFSGDGGLATSAQLNHPQGLAVDATGNVYIADAQNDRIRKLCVDGNGCTAGNINTIAGTTSGLSGDGGPATNAQLKQPSDVALFGGDVYIADNFNHRVRKVCTSGVGCTLGTITTVAGTTPGFSGDGGAATAAQLNYPTSIAIDASGNILIADNYNSRVRKVCRDGIGCTVGTLATVAGTIFGWCGDGGPATSACISSPQGLAVSPSGAVYVADTQNSVIRKICYDGVGCVAGTLFTVAGVVDPTGDHNFPRAQLRAPASVVWVSPGIALFADGGSGRVRRARLESQMLDTVAGYPAGFSTSPVKARYSDLLQDPFGIISYDDAGVTRVIVSERGGHALRQITLPNLSDASSWTIENYGGSLGAQNHADGALGSSRFSSPSGMVYDSTRHRVYVADADNHVVRSIDLAAGTVTTIAGTPKTLGYFGDGSNHEGVDQDSALFRQPSALALGKATNGSANGSLYIADSGNNRVRRLDFDTGLVSTVLGDGTANSSGVGSPSRFFPVDNPQGLVVDTYGNLFVSSRYTLRAIDAGADGVATGDDTVSTIYGRPPRDVFPESVTVCLSGLTFGPGDVDHNELYVLDACQGFWIKLTRGVVP